MKTAYANSDMIETPRERTAEERHEGRARARKIVALAEGGVSGKIGRTDITDLTEDELIARYRRMMRG